MSLRMGMPRFDAVKDKKYAHTVWMGGRLYSSKPHTKKNTKLLLLLHIVFVLTWQLCFFYTSILATTDFSLSGTILFTVSLLVLRRPK